MSTITILSASVIKTQYNIIVIVFTILVTVYIATHHCNSHRHRHHSRQKSTPPSRQRYQIVLFLEGVVENSAKSVKSFCRPFRVHLRSQRPCTKKIYRVNFEISLSYVLSINYGTFLCTGVPLILWDFLMYNYIYDCRIIPLLLPLYLRKSHNNTANLLWHCLMYPSLIKTYPLSSTHST